jgi:hypothetical protein
MHQIVALERGKEQRTCDTAQRKNVAGELQSGVHRKRARTWERTKHRFVAGANQFDSEHLCGIITTL